MTTVAARGRAALGMYPFQPLRASYDRYWQAVSSRVDWLPSHLEWDVDVHDLWTSGDLVVAQTCGWPLITEFRDTVTVLGAFSPLIADAVGATYRSVLLATSDRRPADFAGAVAAVNSSSSLSGWISLLATVHGPGAAWEGDVHWTGSHLASVRAVHDGSAEIASIDAVSLAHIRHLYPDLVNALTVVGHGPRVPCLPIVAGRAIDPSEAAEVRTALADAANDPTLDELMADLLISTFVPLDLDDYLPLAKLAPAKI